VNDFLSRRDLFRMSGLIAVGLTSPRWLSSIAKADLIRQATGGKRLKDTVLVVCQLSGGNDGLNTVIPYARAEYRQLRPTLGIPEEQVLKLDDNLGLHPGLSGFAELFKQGKVAIVQGVGYPRPDRSHFSSMDIWQSGGRDTPRYGWLGRHADGELKSGKFNPVYAIGLSTDRPRALHAKDASIPCFASLTDIQSMIGDPDVERMLRQIQGPPAKEGSPERVVQQANIAAFDAMSELNKRLSQFTPAEQYGNDAFGNGFRQIAQLLATSPATRIVYFSAGGFDTHARQADAHQRLLSTFSAGVSAFQREIEKIGIADNVVVLVFSEFGRRSYENASGGTDHGAAGPMFLIGKRVKGGFHGPIPDLNDLQNGDLKFSIDFRQVYAATLDQWLGGDSKTVLGEAFTPLGVYGA